MMPVVFVSHGAPDALLKASGAVRCWTEIGRRVRAVATPRAILAISAHWEAPVPTASLADAPATIHDFSGFAPSLYQIRYAAPGAPELAERVAQLTGGARHPSRGLDHGAWVPLSVMFPQADIPTTQLSLSHADPAAHLALGRALAPLREEGVLILASGAITHNFAWIDWSAGETEAPLPAALTFADWVAEKLAEEGGEALLDYRSAPLGAQSHPTPEHFLPLFVALGASRGRPQQYRPPFNYRGLAMDAYVWE